MQIYLHGCKGFTFNVLNDRQINLAAPFTRNHLLCSVLNPGIFFWIIFLVLQIGCYNIEGNQEEGGKPQISLNQDASLLELGDEYLKIGQYDSALVSFQKAYRIAKSENNWRELIQSSTYIGTTYGQKGMYDSTAYFLSNSLSLAQDKISQDDSLWVEIYVARSIHHFYTGNLAKQMEFANKGLELGKRIWGEKNIQVANCYNSLGMVSMAKGDFKEAISIFNKAVPIYAALIEKHYIELANCYANLGYSYGDLFEFDEAVSYYQKSIDLLIERGQENHSFLAIPYNNLNWIYNEKRDYERSNFYMNKALGVTLSELGEMHPNTAVLYNNIGSAYNEHGDYDQALLFLEKALNIRKKLLGEDHMDLAHTYNNIGRSYHNKKEFTKAIDNFKKAIAIREKRLGKDHPYIATNYQNLSTTYQEMDDLENALKYCKKGLEIRLAKYPSDHPRIATSYKSLGKVYKEKKDISTAINYISKAEDITSKRFGPKNIQIVDILNYKGYLFYLKNDFEKSLDLHQRALEIQDSFQIKESLKEFHDFKINYAKPDLLTTYKGLSRNYYKRYLQKGDTSDLINAYNHYLTLTELIFDLRAGFQSEQSKIQLVSNFTSFFSEAFSSWFELQKINDTIASFEKGWELLQNYKAFLLQSQVLESKAKSFVNIPDSLLQKEKDLKIDLAYYETSINREELKRNNKDTIRLANWRNKFFELHKQWQSLIYTIEQEYPEYYRIKYHPSIISMPELQSKLLPNQTFLDYYVGYDNIFIFLVQKENYSIHLIKNDFPLAEWVDTLRNSIYDYHLLPDQSPTKYAAANQQYVEIAYQLYQKLIAPLENQLTEQLIIVPDGVLGYLPFDVLLKEKPQKADDFRNHHYLLKDYQISYAYSATLLQEMQDKKHHPTKRLLAFAPSFNGDAIASRNIQDIRRALGNLKYNIPEAEQIHSLMGGDIYKGLEATEPLFWDIASQYQILHLSTHGKADDRVGDYSFLAFSEIPDSIENEKLYVRDLYNLQLNADMVVLSACETGIGELQRGEGILSLARGFAYAGAKSIINTLWSVNDESTQYLMKRFYTHLKAGQPKDAALRQAKLDYIQNGQQADPFFWAAFIPIGDMAPLKFSGNWNYAAWLILLGILVFIFRARKLKLF